jgi:hypothetical protein
MLHDYMAALPLSAGQQASTVCVGPVQAAGALQLPSNDSNAYCSAGIVPKTFVQV